MRPRSRKVKPGERSYLLTGIPQPLHDRVVAKATRLHAEKCGDRIGQDRCPMHALKPILLRLLSDWIET